MKYSAKLKLPLRWKIIFELIEFLTAIHKAVFNWKFSLGYLTCHAFQAMVFDLWGKEKSIRILELSWVNTPWQIWPATLFLIFIALYGAKKLGVDP